MVIGFLENREKDIDTKDFRGQTALYLASKNNQLGIVQHLLVKDANIEAKQDGGETPLYAACSNGHIEVVKHLLSNGAKTEAKQKEGITPFHIACQNGHLEVVKLLLTKGAILESKQLNQETPFYNACKYGRTEVVKHLLSKGANFEAQQQDGLTPLYVACQMGHVDIVKMLLDKGVRIELQPRDNKTPLCIASKEGRLEVVKVLLDQGAKIEAKDLNEKTPLIAAAQNGHLETVKLLVSHGANIKAMDKNGNTPLVSASKRLQLKVLIFLKEKEKELEKNMLESTTAEDDKTENLENIAEKENVIINETPKKKITENSSTDKKLGETLSNKDEKEKKGDEKVGLKAESLAKKKDISKAQETVPTTKGDIMEPKNTKDIMTKQGGKIVNKEQNSIGSDVKMAPNIKDSTVQEKSKSNGKNAPKTGPVKSPVGSSKNNKSNKPPIKEEGQKNNNTNKGKTSSGVPIEHSTAKSAVSVTRKTGEEVGPAKAKHVDGKTGHLSAKAKTPKETQIKSSEKASKQDKSQGMIDSKKTEKFSPKNGCPSNEDKGQLTAGGNTSNALASHETNMKSLKKASIQVKTDSLEIIHSFLFNSAKEINTANSTNEKKLTIPLENIYNAVLNQLHRNLLTLCNLVILNAKDSPRECPSF